MTRAEKIDWSRALRAEGLSAPEIAERVDAPASTVRNWYLGGTCRCGAPIDGSSKRAQEAKFCLECHSQRYVERNDRLVELWENGENSQAIGKALDMSAKAVITWIHHKRINGTPISLHHLTHRDSRDRYAQIAAWIHSGLSRAEIAAELGTTAASVGQMMARARRLGLNMPYYSEVT